MIHFKGDCCASDMIIANRCGLACSNCGACKCMGEYEGEYEKRIMLKNLENLRQRTISIHETIPHQYSFPHFQVKDIDEEIKKLKY